MRGWCGGGVHAVIGGKPHDIDGDGPTGEQREHPDVPDGPGPPPWPPTAHPTLPANTRPASAKPHAHPRSRPTPTRPSQPCTAHVWPRLARARAYGASRAAGDLRTTREARRSALWRHSGQCLGDRPGTPQEMPSQPSRSHAAHVRPQLTRLRARGMVRARGAHPDHAGGARSGPLATPQAAPRRLRCNRGRLRWRVRGALTKPQVPGLRGVPRAFRDYLGDPQSLRVS